MMDITINTTFSAAYSATITKGGIAFNIDSANAIVSGSYVTGDPWVAGPVTYAGKTITTADAIIEAGNSGSMINPLDEREQGYDDRLPSGTGGGAMPYSTSLDIETQLPYSLSAGDSLCASASSNAGFTGGSYSGNPEVLREMAVLTVVSSAPPATAFRPPYVGTEKPAWTTDDVDYTLLPGVASPFDPINDESAFNDFKFSSGYGSLLTYDFQPASQPTQSAIHPRINQNWYPAQQGLIVSRLAVMACSDLPEATEAANRLIQLGIDNYAIHKIAKGNPFMNGAGFGNGRFFPILFAGYLLGDTAMLNSLSEAWRAPASGNQSDYYTFGTPDFTGEAVGRFFETSSFYYSTAAWSGYDAALPKPRADYLPDGVPLFGDPRADGGYQTNESRRDPNKVYDGVGPGAIYDRNDPADDAIDYASYMRISGKPLPGEILAARLIGADSYYPSATLDFVDRWVADPLLWDFSGSYANDGERDIEGYGGSGNEWMRDMWIAHS